MWLVFLAVSPSRNHSASSQSSSNTVISSPISEPTEEWCSIILQIMSVLSFLQLQCTETNTEEDDENDAYLELGNVSPVDLISFSYQIASGMVNTAV